MYFDSKQTKRDDLSRLKKSLTFWGHFNYDRQINFVHLKIIEIGYLNSIIYIRYWYIFYKNYLIGLQAVTQLSKIENKIKSIPLGHNQRIIYKYKEVNEALFYIDKVLEHQIEGDLYKRLGSAVTNFDNRLAVEVKTTAFLSIFIWTRI